MAEYLDIVDAKGCPTGQIVERTVAHAQGLWHRTSHVWLLRRHEGRLQVLLQLRSLTKDSFPGCYDISSAGHIPAGVGFVESALRELEEELGVKAFPSQLIHCGDRKIICDDIFHGQEYHDRQYSRVFCLWLNREAEDFVLQTEELQGVIWMDFSQCCAKVAAKAIPHCIDLEELELLHK